MTQEAWRPSEQPVAWRIRYRSEPGMIGHYPWSYTERKRAAERPECESEQLFTAAQLAAEVARAVAAETERCARTCLDAACGGSNFNAAAEYCAQAIRKAQP